MTDATSNSTMPRSSELSIIAKLAPHLWPKDERWVRVRVVAAMVMLVLAKVATVLTPFVYKEAVDLLAPAEGEPQTAFMLAAGTFVCGALAGAQGARGGKKSCSTSS